jgi:glycosyltransferase involved in cell wall biosynthesis
MQTATVPQRAAIAVLSHSLPPDGGGQATVLGRLLGGLDPASYRLVNSGRRHATTVPAATAWPAARVPQPWLLRKLRKATALQPLVFEAMVASRTRAVARLLRRDRCAAVVGCTGDDLVDLPAAVAAAGMLGIPAYLYYFDDYRFQWKATGLVWGPAAAARLRDRVEARVLAGAAGVIIPNEALADEVRRRSQVPVQIVRNPIDTDLYASLRSRSRGAADGPRRVVYTGAVYEAQGGALRNAARAIEALRAEGRDIALHLYTPDPPERLRAQGIPDSVVVHPAVPLAEAAAIQCRADVLLLPLSFTSNYPELIRTSAPGKFGEYLAAGRPLLVHGPADSFPSRFATAHDCAAVCDVDDIGTLARLLTRLLDDAAWAAAVAHRAVATSDLFAIAPNRRAFLDFVLGQSPGNRNRRP